MKPSAQPASKNNAPAASKKQDGVALYIISPADGDVVTSPVRVQFGLRGMGVAPAGIELKNTGHHHLLIDVEELPDLTAPLPASDNVRHFGGGQTETDIKLAPGRHALQLILGDFAHRPHNPPVMSRQILITVEE
ncbi:MAG: DUF4399 domain-containing protein [Pseudomonadota bacterium]